MWFRTPRVVRREPCSCGGYDLAQPPADLPRREQPSASDQPNRERQPDPFHLGLAQPGQIRGQHRQRRRPAQQHHNSLQELDAEISAIKADLDQIQKRAHLRWGDD